MINEREKQNGNLILSPEEKGEEDELEIGLCGNPECSRYSDKGGKCYLNTLVGIPQMSLKELREDPERQQRIEKMKELCAMHGFKREVSDIKKTEQKKDV